MGNCLTPNRRSLVLSQFCSNLKTPYSALLLFLSIFYAIFLLHILFSPTAIVCHLFHYLDPIHICPPGPPTERNHTANCTISFSSITFLLDIFALAHFLGWFFKAIFVPHRTSLWVASIAFEFIEQALLKYIPTFKECWWDSWLLDVLICNGLSIELSLMTTAFYQRFLHGPRAERPATSFTFQALVMAGFTLADLNCFLLKHVFRLRSISPLNAYRIWFYVFLAVPSIPIAQQQLTLASTTSRHSPETPLIFHLFPFICILLLLLELAISHVHSS